MGSSSLGVSVLGWGASGGTTWQDHQCVRRLNARELAQTLGDREAARELMCGDNEIFRVYNALGRPCRLTPRGDPNPAFSGQSALPQEGAAAAPAYTPPPAPQASSPPSTQRKIAQATAPANSGSQYIVYFPAGVSDVPREYSLVLDKAADAYQTYGYAKIMVSGRPTPGGSESDFQMLSQRRAEAVKAYLIAKGIPADQQKVAEINAALHQQAAAVAIADRHVDIVFAALAIP